MKKKKTLRDYLGQVMNVNPIIRDSMYYFVRDAKENQDKRRGHNVSVRGKIISIDEQEYEVDCFVKSRSEGGVDSDQRWIKQLYVFHDYELIPEEALNKYVGI